MAPPKKSHYTRSWSVARRLDSRSRAARGLLAFARTPGGGTDYYINNRTAQRQTDARVSSNQPCRKSGQGHTHTLGIKTRVHGTKVLKRSCTWAVADYSLGKLRSGHT